MAFIASISPLSGDSRLRANPANPEFLILSKQRRARGACAGKVHQLFYLLYFGGQSRIILNPHHICLSDARDVAVRAFPIGLYDGHRLIGQVLMAKTKETPIMRIAEPFTVLHHYVEAV